MPTSLQTNGVNTVTPGAYSHVDTSGLAQAGLGASGIVAVIGTAIGGKPYTAIKSTSDFLVLNTPNQANKAFTGGDLRDACNVLFQPSADPDIPGGAQTIVAMQVNPATAAQATLSNAVGAAMTVAAQRYGAVGNKVSVLVGAGSAQGRLVIITDGTTTESKDNLGGLPVANLSYSGQSLGWSQVLISVDNAGDIAGAGTANVTGLAPATGLAQPATAINLAIANAAGDAGKVLTLHGLDNNGIAIKEKLTLQTTGQSTRNKFSKVYGVYLSAAAGAAVTVSAASTVYTVAAGAQGFGSMRGTSWFVANAQLTFTGIPSGLVAIIDGTRSDGTQVVELVTGAGATPVVTSNSYSKLNLLVLGGAGTGAIVVTGQALSVLASQYPTIQQASAYVNSLQQTVSSGTSPGFSMIPTAAAITTPLSGLDIPTPKDAASGGGISFTADTYAIVSWITSNSQLVTATQSVGGVGAPTVSATPTFLVGGSENAPTFADYQNCLNLLKGLRINSIVPLTCDPAVIAAVDAHCVYMCGIGRSERDAFVGVQNPTLDGPASLSQVVAATLAINSKNIRACADYPTLYNQQGVAQEFSPAFSALMAAGMQAGAAVGTSLTFKYPRVLSFRHHPSYNSVDDSDTLINAGLLFLQKIDGKGIRWVRNITTYQGGINLAWQNAEVNEALNYSVFTFRNDMEFAVGKPGFSGTANQVITKAKQSLGNLIDAGALTSYDSLTATLTGDRWDVAVQMYPIVGTNFVNISVYAGNQTISAAA